MRAAIFNGPRSITAMQTAVDIARAGSTVGFVDVPHGVELPIERMFRQTIGARGGGAPVRIGTI